MDKPIDSMLDDVKWVECEKPESITSELPYVTHTGSLDIGLQTLKVLQLSNGQRIIDTDDFERLFNA